MDILENGTDKPKGKDLTVKGKLHDESRLRANQGMNLNNQSLIDTIANKSQFSHKSRVTGHDFNLYASRYRMFKDGSPFPNQTGGQSTFTNFA